MLGTKAATNKKPTYDPNNLATLVQEQLQNDQKRYKQQIHARLHCSAVNVSLENFVYVETTLAYQPHKIVLEATVGPYPVTIQRHYNFVKKMFCDRVEKTAYPRPASIRKPPLATDDHSRVLNFLARRSACTFASHSSTPKEKGTGGMPANFNSFDDSSRPLYDVEYYRAFEMR